MMKTWEDNVYNGKLKLNTIKNKSERYNKSVKHTMKTFQIIKRAMSTEVIGNFQKTWLNQCVQCVICVEEFLYIGCKSLVKTLVQPKNLTKVRLVAWLLYDVF